MKLAILAHRHTATNAALAQAAPPGDVCVLAPADALLRLRVGDVALGRLDVMETLDGIEPGLSELTRLEAGGVRVLNGPQTLVAAHDKLATARALSATAIPHPRTVHVVSVSEPVALEPPYVVKPRFGSWGRDVLLCRDRVELRRCLEEVATRGWFHAHGALVQELVAPQGHDLRVVVAGGTVVGAVRRVAPPGEWRTNVALGATRERAVPPPSAREVALAAAGAIDAGLVGVDLLPTPDGGYVAIEVNGAVEFTDEYSLDGDVFERTLRALLPDAVAAVA